MIERPQQSNESTEELLEVLGRISSIIENESGGYGAIAAQFFTAYRNFQEAHEQGAVAAEIEAATEAVNEAMSSIADRYPEAKAIWNQDPSLHNHKSEPDLADTGKVSRTQEWETDMSEPYRHLRTRLQNIHKQLQLVADTEGFERYKRIRKDLSRVISKLRVGIEKDPSKREEASPDDWREKRIKALDEVVRTEVVPIIIPLKGDLSIYEAANKNFPDAGNIKVVVDRILQEPVFVKHLPASASAEKPEVLDLTEAEEIDDDTSIGVSADGKLDTQLAGHIRARINNVLEILRPVLIQRLLTKELIFLEGLSKKESINLDVLKKLLKVLDQLKSSSILPPKNRSDISNTEGEIQKLLTGAGIDMSSVTMDPAMSAESKGAGEGSEITPEARDDFQLFKKNVETLVALLSKSQIHQTEIGSLQAFLNKNLSLETVSNNGDAYRELQEVLNDLSDSRILSKEQYDAIAAIKSYVGELLTHSDEPDATIGDKDMSQESVGGGNENIEQLLRRVVSFQQKYLGLSEAEVNSIFSEPDETEPLDDTAISTLYQKLLSRAIRLGVSGQEGSHLIEQWMGQLEDLYENHSDELKRATGGLISYNNSVPDPILEIIAVRESLTSEIVIEKIGDPETDEVSDDEFIDDSDSDLSPDDEGDGDDGEGMDAFGAPTMTELRNQYADLLTKWSTLNANDPGNSDLEIIRSLLDAAHQEGDRLQNLKRNGKRSDPSIDQLRALHNQQLQIKQKLDEYDRTNNSQEGEFRLDLKSAITTLSFEYFGLVNEGNKKDANIERLINGAESLINDLETGDYGEKWDAASAALGQAEKAFQKWRTEISMKKSPEGDPTLETLQRTCAEKFKETQRQAAVLARLRKLSAAPTEAEYIRLLQREKSHLTSRDLQSARSELAEAEMAFKDAEKASNDAVFSFYNHAKEIPGENADAKARAAASKMFLAHLQSANMAKREVEETLDPSPVRAVRGTVRGLGKGMDWIGRNVTGRAVNWVKRRWEVNDGSNWAGRWPRALIFGIGGSALATASLYALPVVAVAAGIAAARAGALYGHEQAFVRGRRQEVQDALASLTNRVANGEAVELDGINESVYLLQKSERGQRLLKTMATISGAAVVGGGLFAADALAASTAEEAIIESALPDPSIEPYVPDPGDNFWDMMEGQTAAEQPEVINRINPDNLQQLIHYTREAINADLAGMSAAERLQLGFGENAGEIYAGQAIDMDYVSRVMERVAEERGYIDEPPAASAPVASVPEAPVDTSPIGSNVGAEVPIADTIEFFNGQETSTLQLPEGYGTSRIPGSDGLALVKPDGTSFELQFNNDGSLTEATIAKLNEAGFDVESTPTNHEFATGRDVTPESLVGQADGTVRVDRIGWHEGNDLGLHWGNESGIAHDPTSDSIFMNISSMDLPSGLSEENLRAFVSAGEMNSNTPFEFEIVNGVIEIPIDSPARDLFAVGADGQVTFNGGFVEVAEVVNNEAGRLDVLEIKPLATLNAAGEGVSTVNITDTTGYNTTYSQEITWRGNVAAPDTPPTETSVTQPLEDNDAQPYSGVGNRGEIDADIASPTTTSVEAVDPLDAVRGGIVGDPGDIAVITQLQEQIAALEQARGLPHQVIDSPTLESLNARLNELADYNMPPATSIENAANIDIDGPRGALMDTLRQQIDVLEVMIEGENPTLVGDTNLEQLRSRFDYLIDRLEVNPTDATLVEESRAALEETLRQQIGVLEADYGEGLTATDGMDLEALRTRFDELVAQGEAINSGTTLPVSPEVPVSAEPVPGVGYAETNAGLAPPTPSNEYARLEGLLSAVQEATRYAGFYDDSGNIAVATTIEDFGRQLGALEPILHEQIANFEKVYGIAPTNTEGMSTELLTERLETLRSANASLTDINGDVLRTLTEQPTETENGLITNLRDSSSLADDAKNILETQRQIFDLERTAGVPHIDTSGMDSLALEERLAAIEAQVAGESATNAPAAASVAASVATPASPAAFVVDPEVMRAQIDAVRSAARLNPIDTSSYSPGMLQQLLGSSREAAELAGVSIDAINQGLVDDAQAATAVTLPPVTDFSNVNVADILRPDDTQFIAQVTDTSHATSYLHQYVLRDPAFTELNLPFDEFKDKFNWWLGSIGVTADNSLAEINQVLGTNYSSIDRAVEAATIVRDSTADYQIQTFMGPNPINLSPIVEWMKRVG